MLTIQSNTLIDLATVQAAVHSIIGNKTFDLPEADQHVVGVSGGVDSSAVALVLKALHPTQHFIFVHSDTGVETLGTSEALANLELALEEKIFRIKGKKGLFDVIKDFGSFLPSARARYCTRISKILPFQAFMADRFSPSDRIVSYVGIRADESHRKAATHSDGTTNFFPLQSLQMGKREVMRLLDITIGIPSFYRDRSRSGCSVCCFARRSELIGQWRSDPKAVADAAMLEKISEEDLGVLMNVPDPVSTQIGVGRNWLSFPVPGAVDDIPLPFEHIRRVANKKDRRTSDMFNQDDMVTLFAAVEYTRFWDGFQWQIANQNLVTYSKSLGGLKTSLKFFWRHRLDTMELSLVSNENSLRDDLHVGIFELAIDGAVIDSLDLDGAFTWQSDGTPLLAIRKNAVIVENVLLASEIARIQSSSPSINSYDRELVNIVGSKQILASGTVLWSGMFDKPFQNDLVDDDDLSDAPEPCISCSR
ncbi:hypothetical protein N9L66_00535 [Porticoccaceae bacterium]|nr:hypothetical protein [Porticoccaceae bacterium]